MILRLLVALALASLCVGCAGTGATTTSGASSDPLLASVVRIDVPTSVTRRGNRVTTRYATGAGVVLANGDIVTAMHIFVDEARSRPGDYAFYPDDALSGITVRAWDQPRDRGASPFATGGSVRAFPEADLAVFTPRSRDRLPSGVRIATRAPEPSETLTAYLLSESRATDDRLVLAKLTSAALGPSTNTPHFALAGESTRGDSGGPVFDASGRLVGIIAGGGPGCAPFTVSRFDLSRRDAFAFRWRERADSTCAEESILAVDVPALLAR
jgi:hypothetical protein